MLMEILSKATPVAMLVFVVSSMLAVGVSLTVEQSVAPAGRRGVGRRREDRSLTRPPHAVPSWRRTGGESTVSGGCRTGKACTRQGVKPESHRVYCPDHSDESRQGVGRIRHTRYSRR